MILISVLNWLLLAQFRLRVYYAIIPLLLSIQILLNDLLEHLLLSRTYSTRWFALLTLPGTIIHEFSHAIAALAAGCRITSLSLFNFNRGSVLGSVTYVSKRDRLSFVRDLLISLSPFFGSSVAMIIVSKYMLGGVMPFNSFSMDAGGVSAGIAGLLAFLAGQYSLGFASMASFFALYLQVCFAFGAAPSSIDFQGLSTSLRKNPSGFLLLVLVLASALLLVEYPPALWGYGGVLAGIVVSSLDWIVFLLCFSIAMLVFSLLSVYSVSLWLESPIALKITSALVFVVVYHILPAFLPKNLSLAAAWASGVVILLSFKYRAFFLKPSRSS